MQIPERCDKIRTNQGKVNCPDCGSLLARTDPGVEAHGLWLYCRKCRKQVPVNIPKQRLYGQS